MDDFQHNVILEYARGGNLTLQELEYYSGYVLYLTFHNISKSNDLITVLGHIITEKMVDDLDVSYIESVYMLFNSDPIHISSHLSRKLKTIYG